MMVNGSMVWQMVSVPKCLIQAHNMRVSGSMTKCKVKEFTSGRMVKNMKAIT